MSDIKHDLMLYARLAVSKITGSLVLKGIIKMSLLMECKAVIIVPKWHSHKSTYIENQ